MTLRLNCYIFRDDLEISALQYTKAWKLRNAEWRECSARFIDFAIIRIKVCLK